METIIKKQIIYISICALMLGISTAVSPSLSAVSAADSTAYDYFELFNSKVADIGYQISDESGGSFSPREMIGITCRYEGIKTISSLGTLVSTEGPEDYCFYTYSIPEKKFEALISKHFRLDSNSTEMLHQITYAPYNYCGISSCSYDFETKSYTLVSDPGGYGGGPCFVVTGYKLYENTTDRYQVLIGKSDSDSIRLWTPALAEEYADKTYGVDYVVEDGMLFALYNLISVDITFDGNNIVFDSYEYPATKGSITSGYCINHEHSFDATLITKATPSANGKRITKCSDCAMISKEEIIYSPKTASLSNNEFIYNGKTKNPKVTIKDTKGNIISNDNYTITKSGNCKNVGKHTYTIIFKNNYQGKKTVSFMVKPKGTSITKLRAISNGIKITWAKRTRQVSGYEIRYKSGKSSKKATTVRITNYKATTKTIKKLIPGKKYYVQIRTYKTVNGKRYYSSWSKTKTITTKK